MSEIADEVADGGRLFARLCARIFVPNDHELRFAVSEESELLEDPTAALVLKTFTSVEANSVRRDGDVHTSTRVST